MWISHFKRHAHTHYTKQNSQCLDCNRQLVAESRLISEATTELIKNLLLEPIALRGICRALKLSLPCLLSFIAELYEQLPDDLNVDPVMSTARVPLLRLAAEADQTWSFVGKKANKQWTWLALEAQTKQVIAFYIGDRSRRSARKLWQRMAQA